MAGALVAVIVVAVGTHMHTCICVGLYLYLYVSMCNLQPRVAVLYNFISNRCGDDIKPPGSFHRGCSSGLQGCHRAMRFRD